MAGHKYNIPLAADISFFGTKTLLQIVAPATRDIWVLGWEFGGKSTEGSNIPVKLEWVRQTSAGTGGVAIFPVPEDPDLPAALCSVLTGFTAEPTDGGLLVAGPTRLHPAGGNIILQRPLGEEFKIKAGTRSGIRMISGQLTDLIGNVRILE